MGTVNRRAFMAKLSALVAVGLMAPARLAADDLDRLEEELAAGATIRGRTILIDRPVEVRSNRIDFERCHLIVTEDGCFTRPAGAPPLEEIRFWKNHFEFRGESLLDPGGTSLLHRTIGELSDPRGAWIPSVTRIRGPGIYVHRLEPLF